jgi:hypothetical protein
MVRFGALLYGCQYLRVCADAVGDPTGDALAHEGRPRGRRGGWDTDWLRGALCDTGPGAHCDAGRWAMAMATRAN